MIRDAFQDVAQIEFRIQTVELGGAQQGINRSRAFAA
jgi:hypothetical protein